MIRPKKIHWGFAIVSLFFIGLAVDYFFLHILFQQKIRDQQQREEEVVPKTEVPTSRLQPKAAPAKPTEVAYQEPKAVSASDFQSKATQCMGPELGKSTTPDDLLRELFKNDPIVSSQFELENTHIQLPDGSERRMHLILADDTQHKGALELRYFKLDAEGLPERIPLSREQTYNPKPEFLQSLKSQGKTIYHETKDTRTLKDGTSMILTMIDDKVYEFQIFAQGKTFSCREMNCACR